MLGGPVGARKLRILMRQELHGFWMAHTLWRVSCLGWNGLQALELLSSPIYLGLCSLCVGLPPVCDILFSDMTTRILVFNCTSGRSGSDFLATILDTIEAQLRHQNIGTHSSKDFFDHVIFCTNVTYVDGGSKPG